MRRAVLARAAASAAETRLRTSRRTGKRRRRRSKGSGRRWSVEHLRGRRTSLHGAQISLGPRGFERRLVLHLHDAEGVFFFGLRRASPAARLRFSRSRLGSFFLGGDGAAAISAAASDVAFASPLGSLGALGRRRRLLLLPVDSPSLRRARLRGSCPLRARDDSLGARVLPRARLGLDRRGRRRDVPRRDARDASSRTIPRPHRWCLGGVRGAAGIVASGRARATSLDASRRDVPGRIRRGPVGVVVGAERRAARGVAQARWRRRRRDARARRRSRRAPRTPTPSAPAGRAPWRIARHAAPSRAPVSRRSVPAGAGDAPSSVARRARRPRGAARSPSTPRARPTIANAFEAARGYSAGRASTNAALVVVTTRRDVVWRFGPGERTEEF